MRPRVGAKRVELDILRAVFRSTVLAALLAVFALLAPPAPAQQPEPPRGGRQAGATAESEANADGAGGGPQVEARGSEPLTEAGDDPAEEGEGAGEKKRRRVEPFETTNLEDPVFPTPRVRDAFRIRLQSRFLPAGSFDSFDVDLYRPELRLRATAPLSARAVLQLTVRLSTSVYDFDGRGDFMNPGGPDPLSGFYRAGLTVQGGFRLNRSGSLFVKGEMWSVLASIRGGSRWESGAFAEGLTGAGALALGYQIDDVVRLAVGAVVGSRLDRGGVKVSPVGSLKWHVSDRVTVRNRGRGLQVEYAPNRKLKVFAAGFFDDDAFRLDSRPGLPDDLTFRDDTIQAGLGFDWKLSKHFRINFEGGAVAWREIRLKSNDLGTLFKETGSPGAYLDLRLEMRP